jgi:glycosyltransferase involved in cell wall biosynthesis
MKKILFANGRPTPPISLGGDSVSVNILFNYLHNKGYSCYAFGVLNPSYSTTFNLHSTKDILQRLRNSQIQYKFTRKLWQIFLSRNLDRKYLAIKRTIDYSYSYAKCRMVRTESFQKELDKYIRDIKPDLIITQIESVSEVISEAKKWNLPLILIIQDMELYNIKNIDLANSHPKALILFISEAVKKQFSRYCKVPTAVWYHPLNITKTSSRKKLTKGYITMINPVFVKGGRIFHDIALALPKMKFLAVENWYDPKIDDIDYSDTKNVKVIKRQDDMHAIYNKTKLLLVPSIWQEAFGRVVVEAGLYGIPTIASDTGGLKEAVGNGGVVLKNYWDVNAWGNAIAKVLKKDQYHKLGLDAHRHALKFDTKIQGKKFELLMTKLLNKNKYVR